jgi:MFS family permease
MMLPVAERLAATSRIYYGWILVFALGAMSVVIIGTASTLFGIVLVPIQHELGWSRGEISGAYSLSYLVWGLAGIPTGQFIDRHGARKVMAVGALLGAGCLALLSTATQLWQFYVLWGLGLGLAVGLTSQLAAITVVTNWFYIRRGMALGLFAALSGLALPIYVPSVAWMVAHAGWRHSLLAVAIAFLLIPLPLAVLLVRRRPEDLGLRRDGQAAAAPVSEPSVSAGLTLREAISRPAFWTLAISAAGASVAYAGVTAHQIPFLIGRHFDPVLAATFVGLAGLMSIPGRFLFNAAGDRFGAKGLLALTIAVQGVGIAILIQASSVPSLILYVVVYGAGFGAASGLRAAMMADQWGRRAFGAISAVMGLASYGFSAAGPATVGWLYDRFGSYELAFSLAVACYALAVVAVLLTPSAPPELSAPRENRRPAAPPA